MGRRGLRGGRRGGWGEVVDGDGNWPRGRKARIASEVVVMVVHSYLAMRASNPAGDIPYK